MYSSGDTTPYIDINAGSASSFLEPYVEFCYGNIPSWTCYSTGISTQLSLGHWYHLVGTWSSSSTAFTFYVNGASYGGSSNTIIPLNSPSFYLTNGFNGLITNVQIYNTSLSASQVATLYSEGIGGNPVALQNLVGWWPLNGNSNDYSGNNNNGAPTSVVYSSSWTK
jgi:hypothetical protein